MYGETVRQDAGQIPGEPFRGSVGDGQENTILLRKNPTSLFESRFDFPIRCRHTDGFMFGGQQNMVVQDADEFHQGVS